MCMDLLIFPCLWIYNLSLLILLNSFIRGILTFYESMEDVSTHLRYVLVTMKMNISFFFLYKSLIILKHIHMNFFFFFVFLGKCLFSKLSSNIFFPNTWNTFFFFFSFPMNRSIGSTVCYTVIIFLAILKKM